jgi:hypothetical protein
MSGTAGVRVFWTSVIRGYPVLSKASVCLAKEVESRENALMKSERSIELALKNMVAMGRCQPFGLFGNPMQHGGNIALQIAV